MRKVTLSPAPHCHVGDLLQVDADRFSGHCVIESTFSIVEQVCRNVKRWHDGDQRERWVGSGLLVAEKQFRRVQGYKQIPILIRELESVTPNMPAVAKRRRAS